MKKSIFAALGVTVLTLLGIASLARAAPAVPTARALDGSMSAADFGLALRAPVDPGPMQSRIYVLNPNASAPATVDLKLIDTSGNVVYTYSTFTVAVNGAVSQSLPNNSFTGSAVVSSDQQVKALVTNSNSALTAQDSYEGATNGYPTLILPFVRHLAPTTQDSKIAVQNTSGSAANVTLTLYDQAGNQAASKSVSIPASASYYFKTDDLFNSPFIGSAVLNSSARLVATEQTLFQLDTAAARGMASGESGPTVFAPFVERTENGGSVVNWSELYVRNNGTSPTSITVQYYALPGVPVGSPKVANNVPVNGMASFLTNDPGYSYLGSTFQGWAKVTSSGSPIAAYSLAVEGSGVRLFGREGLGPNRWGQGFVCGDVFRSSIQDTRINVLKQGPAKTSVTISLYRASDGALLVSKSYPIAPNQMFNLGLSSPDFAPAGNNYEGMAQVEVPLGQQIAASVFTPYVDGKGPEGITSYDCAKLH